MIYPDHRVVAVEEDDIDREAHEEHMHPHEGLYTAANEEHPFARFEACSPEQATALAGETASVFEARAQDGRASLVKCAEDLCTKGLCTNGLGAHRVIAGR